MCQEHSHLFGAISTFLFGMSKGGVGEWEYKEWDFPIPWVYIVPLGLWGTNLKSYSKERYNHRRRKVFLLFYLF